jgi:integrase/recombinase XerC
LWHRLGLRINEPVMLDIRDWRPDLGEFGKLHARHGKGSRERGAKARLVPVINGADRLIDWWLAEVRHQFGNDWSDPDPPMLPASGMAKVLSSWRHAIASGLRWPMPAPPGRARACGIGSGHVIGAGLPRCSSVLTGCDGCP